MPTNEIQYDHLVKPLEKYSAKAVYGSTFCKRPIEIQILVEDGVVTGIGGTVECPYSKQWLGALISQAKGLDVDAAWGISGDDLRSSITPPEHEEDCVDCDVYAVAAFRLALRNWEKKV